MPQAKLTQISADQQPAEAPVPAPAVTDDLIAVLAAADRKLLFADYLRFWRYAQRLTTMQVARMIGGISHSFIEAIERAVYEPADVEPRIMGALLRLAGPLPEGLSYPEPPLDAAFPIAGGVPEGAGDDASSACARGTAPGGVHRSPAPEGADDDDRLPILSLIDGDIAIQPFPELGTVRVLTPDQATRFAAQLTNFALTARQLSTKPT